MIKEAWFSTDATHHFMVTSPLKPSVLVVLITTRRADLMGAWTAVRSLLPAVAPLCP